MKSYKIINATTFEEVAEVKTLAEVAKIIGTSSPALTQNRKYPDIRFTASKGFYVVDMLQPQAVALLKIERIKAMFDNPDYIHQATKAINKIWKEIELI